MARKSHGVSYNNAIEKVDAGKRGSKLSLYKWPKWVTGFFFFVRGDLGWVYMVWASKNAPHRYEMSVEDDYKSYDSRLNVANNRP